MSLGAAGTASAGGGGSSAIGISESVQHRQVIGGDNIQNAKRREQLGVLGQRRLFGIRGLRCATFARAADEAFPPLPYLSRLALPVEVFPEFAPEPDDAIFTGARLLQGH